MSRKFTYNSSLLYFLVVCLLSFTQLTQAAESKFNHDKTGFELIGPHERVKCNTCHLRGIFKGTPKQCVNCHDRGSRIATSLKPPTHIPTTGSCDNCHAGNTWAVTLFDHDGVAGSCLSCHNGSTAKGKHPGHVQSSNTCDDCHSTVSWSPARFDHDAVTGSCFSCHNGVTATGKHPTHIASSNTCDDCHITTSWRTNRVDHSAVVGGSCFTCHNGVNATGKTPTHVASSNICDDCHSTSAWVPVINFDHASVTGSCASCHNGITATGPSQNHFQSSLPCETCHRNTYWQPDIHQHDAGGDYPGDHASDPSCIQCHGANNTTVTWNNTYAPDCAACHAPLYESKRTSHKKYESPEEFYTTSELQNCTTSSCHILNRADNSIKESRSPRHFINRGSW